MRGKRRGVYRRVNMVEMHGDAFVVLRPGDYVAATLVLTCGHRYAWELQCIDDGGRVFAIRRPPHGIWCITCRGNLTAEQARSLPG